MKDFICIILAAGESTRMKSNAPKVLHDICGRPMIDYVVDSVQKLRLRKIFAVVNKQHNKVLEYLKKNRYIRLVFQRKAQGTADALRSSKKFLSKSKTNVLVICADTPLIKKETLQSLINQHKEKHSSCTILTAFLDNPFGFGRILRDQYSKVNRIIEENDATFSQKQIREVNSGIYCFNTYDLLQALDHVEMNIKKKEYYLTDVVKVLYKINKRINTYVCSDADEVLGINSRLDLSKANDVMRLRIIEEFLEEGVTIVAPKTTFINYGVSIGRETTVYPFTFIESGVKIGDNCSIGPFCHLRKGTVIKNSNIVGNFTEIVRSTLGEGTYFKHFGYLGDASIGKKVNIGAGTAIANFDGENKNLTVIKDKSFIGCDTVIVAPAKIGKGVITGAGSVITGFSNVKDNSVVVGVPARPLIKSKHAKLSKKTRGKKRKR
ncbi:MAG: bifunctional N-acetylglucosamine-1-phosphate uridyltransferase/glucosamine-1-phosphate acetyltransferase [Candidatus Omnitrophica bacterium]|nr:bifunctional N-acetylglucosamine-1-phosphate uridyltransferase/glucosamine-1-phosphate acetyltransferase [Candidatus Omnitrophota bacterium]